MREKRKFIYVFMVLLLGLSEMCFAVQALGGKGLTRQQSSDIFDQNENYALIIGVDRYDEIGDLRYAVADAEALGAFFKSQGYDVEVLFNDQARRTNVLRKLRDIAELAGDGSGDSGSVVFAFSGHGFRADEKNYLATVDTEVDDIRSTGLALNDVKSILSEANVRQRVLLIDACRDDPERPTKGAQGRRGSFVTDQDSEGLAVLYSTGAERRSWEDGNLGQGVFTHYLLQGLKGGAAGASGLVTFDGLQRYVRNRVKKHVRRHFRTVQIPYISGERSGEFVLAKVAPKPVPNPIHVPETVAAPAPAMKRTPKPAPESVATAETKPAPSTPEEVQSTEPHEAMGRLWVKATPSDARVRIMNIRPKYSDGMSLKRGEYYQLLVTKAGYHDWERRTKLGKEKKEVKATLRKLVEEAKPRSVVAKKRFDFEPKMVTLPSGSFRMGCQAGDRECTSEEKPVHTVRVSGFKLAATEVTNAQFRAFVEDSNFKTEAERKGNEKESCFARQSFGRWKWRSGFTWKKSGIGEKGHFPVVCVSWNDAQAYARWLKEKTGRNYRLPSEAEWGYAARGDSTSRYYFGDKTSKLCSYGNGADDTPLPHRYKWSGGAPCRDNAWSTAPVGTYKGTWKGLKDMHGNVAEWTEDYHHENYSGAPSDGSAWLTGGHSRRVLRGGSWRGSPTSLRTTSRSWGGSAFRADYVGFRVVEGS